jgi:hypothetical protein
MIGGPLDEGVIEYLDSELPDELNHPRQIVDVIFKALAHRMTPAEHKQARQLYADGLFAYATGGTQRNHDPYRPKEFQHQNAPLEPPLGREGEPAIKDLRPKDRRLGPIE